MPVLYLGLMSGTSMDGVDAVLCECESGRFVRSRARFSAAYPAALRSELLHVQRTLPALTLADFCRLDNAVAQIFADSALGLLEHSRTPARDVIAIGSHGQTVFHDPDGVRSSLQLGNPSLVAVRTGIDTVADFRRADIAQGGQGAPLVPAFHQALFAAPGETRAVLNIGGIANLTLLPGTSATRVRGFDCGPGNGLMDEWIGRHRGLAYDEDGAWARSGQLQGALLEALLADDYFRAAPPKSTGRHHFNLDWVQRRYPDLGRLAPQDVQRSLCELSAHSIADDVRHLNPAPARLMLCGGGAHNGLLRERLQALLPGVELGLTDDYGLASGEVEAAAFAWLAMRCVEGLAGNLPAVTGAAQPAILGGLYRTLRTPGS